VNRVADRIVLAVDGNSLVHRSFHAQARTGLPSWAVRGLLGQLVAAVDRIRPTLVVVGFDDPDRSLRRDDCPSYKAGRPDKLPTLVEQLREAITALRELGVAVVVPDGLEADDVLASTAAFARAAGAATVILTSDRDAFALIDADTTVLRLLDGGVEASPLMTADRLMLLLGVQPGQYRDFAALRGDPSDNLPGVRGIGPRLAARLLTEFGTAAAAFDDLAAVRARLGAGVADRLGVPEARVAWALNCRLMAMRDDLPLALDLDSGAGVLPLSAAAVQAVFGSQNLTWTLGAAVRVLAGVEPPAGVERRAELPDATPGSAWLWRGDDWDDTRPVRRRGQPQLRRPAAAQLSLFDPLDLLPQAGGTGVTRPSAPTVPR
jgi:DNA polymerase-1